MIEISAILYCKFIAHLLNVFLCEFLLEGVIYKTNSATCLKISYKINNFVLSPYFWPTTSIFWKSFRFSSSSFPVK